MPEPKTGWTPSARKRRLLWQPWAFLLLGAALTGGRWSGLRREDAHRHDLLQQAQAEALADRVLQRTREIGHVLAGAASYLEREPLPSRAEWRGYVDRLGLISAKEGIQGLSFAEWIPRGGLPAHLERVRREGFPDYQVLPGGGLPAEPEGLSSIVLLEPMDERNQRAFGRDMWADPVRREAMARARDTGHAALSGKLKLYQEGEADVQAGLVLYAPVYRRGLPLDSVAARRKALLGWATCVLRAGDFLDALLHDAHTRMDIDLFEGREATPQARLYDTDPSLALGKGGRLIEQRLEVAGRTWTLHIQQNPDLAPGGAPPDRYEVLASGLLISGLFAALWLAISRDAHRSRLLAERRGEVLAAREAQFATLYRKAPVGLSVVEAASGRFLSVNPAFARMLGYTPEELEQRSFQSVSDPEGLEKDLAVVRDVDGGAVDLADREKCYLHRDGHRVWARLRLVRLPEEPGLPLRRLALVEDISELQRAATFSRSVLDAMPASVAVLDAEGRILEVNRRWEAFGADNGGAGIGPGCSYLEAATGAFEAAGAGIREVIAGRRDRFVHEYECSAPDQQRWFQMQATPIPGHAGCLVAHLDITALKQAEAATRASESLFRGLFELSPDPITLSDLDSGRLLQVNPAWCELVGIPRERALGRTTTELGTWEDPSEREAVVAELQRTGRVEARSATLRSARGESHPMMFTARAIDLLGRRCLLVMAKNLTGFLQAQEAQRASEARFRLLAENARDLVFRYRYLPEPGFEFISPSLIALTGYEPEELYRDPLLYLQMVHPEDQRSLLDVASSTGDHLSLRFRWIHRDGRTIWTDQLLRLERDAAGRVLAVQGSGRDVDAEVRVQRRLEEQVQRYASLMETSLDAIHVLDAEGRLRYWNPAFLEHLGCEAAEAGQMTVDQWDRQWTAEELRRMIQELIDQPRRFETVHRRRDGTLRHVEINAAGVHYDGEPMLLAAARDVTDRVAAEQALRRSETRFRTLFKLLPVGVTLTDPQGQIIHTNPASEALLGIPSNDMLRREFKGPYWDILRPDGTPMPPEEYASVRALNELQRIDNVEMGVRRPDGGIAWITVSAEPVIDTDLGVIIVYSDITARKRAEEALREREAMLRGLGDNLPDSYMYQFRLGPDGSHRLLHVSAGVERLCGVRPEEVIADPQKLLGLLDPEQAPAYFAAMEDSARDLSVFIENVRQRGADGQWHWFRVCSQPRRGADGSVVWDGVVIDLTQPMAVQQALQASESRLRLLSDQLPDSFIYQYTVDPDSGPRFTYVSAGVERIAGVAAEDAVRDPGLLLGQIDPSQLPAYLAAEATSGATGTSFAIELKIRRADGEARWFRLRSTPRTQDDGSVAWEGIATDITEQMEGQIALAEAEARWKFALEGSGQGVWDWNAETNEVYFSPRWKEMLGYTEAEIGARLEEWDSRLHPEDREATYRQLQRYLDGDAPIYESEHRLRCKDGSYRWVQDRGMAVAWNAEGRPVRLIGVHLDITERVRSGQVLQESEGQFRAIFDGSANAIFLHDLEGRIRECNLQASQSSGYTRKELLDMRITDLDREVGLHGAGDIWSGLAEDQVFEYSGHQTRKDGTRYPIAVRGRRIHLQGQPLVLALVHDLSERERAKASDLRAQKAESLVLMAGSIAHDFNNLFQALLASLDLAELKASGDPAVVAPLRNGREVLRRAVGLSWKMLDFSGRAIARLEPVDLGPLLSAWRPGLEGCLGGPRLDLALAEVPLVLADPGKLRQVLEALLANAREAMDGAGLTQGRVRLSLAVDFHEDRPDRSTTGTWVADPPPGPATVCLEVADEGPGATPQVLARMFDPFFTTRDLGRGLGLPSALGLLQAHRAGLHVLLREGGGLAFRIHLPLVGS